MPKPKVNGTLQPVEQPREILWDPRSGSQLVRTFECADPNGLYGIAAGFAGSLWGYRHSTGGPKSVLVASASGADAGQPEVTTDTWQILANEIQKDVKEHPTFLAMEESFPGTIGYVVDDVDRYNQRQPAGTPAPAAGAAATAALLFNLLVRGTTHYALSQYVLRHTTNVSNRYAANVADTNIERVYTTDQLLTEAQSANFWSFPLPGRMGYKISNIGAPTARTGYLWGWRKLASTETTSANNRVEITTEYWLEQWPLVLYPAGTFAPP